jgi:hypothetical protein
MCIDSAQASRPASLNQKGGAKLANPLFLKDGARGASGI